MIEQFEKVAENADETFVLDKQEVKGKSYHYVLITVYGAEFVGR